MTMEIDIQEDLIYPEQFILHGDLDADRSIELIRKIGLSFDKSIYFGNPFEFTFIDSHDFYVNNKVIFPLNEEIPNNTPRIKLSELDHAFLEREKGDLQGEPVLVSKVNLSLGILENQYIQFNKNEMTLSACPYPNKQEDREKNQKQEQKKENREPDTSPQKNNRNRRMKF